MRGACVERAAEAARATGFVHGDLHPGNIRVLPAPPASRTAALLRRASPAPLLVLLDHGLYATLEEPLRLAYCALWCVLRERRACLLLSNRVLMLCVMPPRRRQAVALGDGAAAAAAGAVLVPGTGPQWALLTMRPEQLNKQQRSDVRAAAGLQVRTACMRSCASRASHVWHLKRAWRCAQTAADVGEFLEGVPPALGVAFRAQGLLRSVTLSLGLPRNARMWRMLTARARLPVVACAPLALRRAGCTGGHHWHALSQRCRSSGRNGCCAHAAAACPRAHPLLGPRGAPLQRGRMLSASTRCRHLTRYVPSASTGGTGGALVCAEAVAAACWQRTFVGAGPLMQGSVSCSVSAPHRRKKLQASARWRRFAAATPAEEHPGAVCGKRTEHENERNADDPRYRGSSAFGARRGARRE
jgi:hypothetical protein